MTKTVLSIAGFDGSGGAGIQADLKTFAALGCYGMTVLTALPIQNTTGVKNCYEIPIQAIIEQLDVIFADIIPDAIKIGMLLNTQVIETVADFLEKHAAHIPIVLDPVMVASSGDRLLLPEAIKTLKTRLIPQCTILTPNLPEAQTLLDNCEDICEENAIAQAEKLLTLGFQAILLKGGHFAGEMANDLYLSKEEQPVWLEGHKINTKNTHGTGCTLSSAIAAHLALGFERLESCQRSKHYLQKAIEAAKNQSIGHGAGPVHHFYHLWSAEY